MIFIAGPLSLLRLTSQLPIKLEANLDIFSLNSTLQNLRKQVMTTNLWIEQFWYDYKLKWNPEEYGGEYSLWTVLSSLGKTQHQHRSTVIQVVDFQRLKDVSVYWIWFKYFTSDLQISLTWNIPKTLMENVLKRGPTFAIFIILKLFPLLSGSKPCRGEIILLIYNLSDLTSHHRPHWLPVLAQMTQTFLIRFRVSCRCLQSPCAFNSYLASWHCPLQ